MGLLLGLLLDNLALALPVGAVLGILIGLLAAGVSPGHKPLSTAVPPCPFENDFGASAKRLMSASTRCTMPGRGLR